MFHPTFLGRCRRAGGCGLAALAALVLLLSGCSPMGRTPAALTAGSPLEPQALRCEYLVNPLGMDVPRPRLSWTLASPQRGARQTAYQLQVATTPSLLQADQPDLWDSGKVLSSEQNQIDYQGTWLRSRQACVWRVRAWDGANGPGPWSPIARWEVGLRTAADWHAQWIDGGAAAHPRPLVVQRAIYAADDGSAAKDVTAIVQAAVHDNKLALSVNNRTLGPDPAPNRHKHLRLTYALGDQAPVEQTYAENNVVQIPALPLQYLRQTFRVNQPILRARLYATALGLYAIQINGRPVGDHVLAPDWTDYRKRVRYQAYDVTPLLKTGSNAIAATVANGWYAGHIGNGGFQFWGTEPCVMAQVELTLADGSVQTICTDGRWQSHDGPILSTDIMDGESFDARAELPASDPRLVEDAQWTAVKVRTGQLVPQIDAQVDQPVRELMTLRARSMFEPTPGHWVFDLGQNMVGVPRIRVAAPAGTVVTLRFAEMLNPDRTIYTANYRGAKSTDTYICRGGGMEQWQPRFTFHGFRYVELTGLPRPPARGDVIGVVLGSDTPSVGEFSCSDPRINQLWSNIRWGQRGNFLSVPTDCPQRDERLGWMGDAQIFIGTAVYNADVSAFFTKWLVDVDDEQRPAGQFTETSPDENTDGHGTPAWSDAGVICPWTIYRTYGDRRELAQHLPHMMRWVDWCETHSDGLIRDRDRGGDFGDWLSIDADTPKDLIGTAFFAHSADLVARSAAVVGDDASAARYADLFRRVRAAFDRKYVSADGHVAGETQTGYAIALAFELLPDELRAPAAAHLADNVRAKGNHLSTGFVGVSYLLPVLADHGHLALAYDLLMQDTFPSWLFSVRHGATTIWERWDGWTPEKGFQDPGMNSFNHYSLGSCGQWLYAGVAGIGQPADGTGFSRVVIWPRLGGGLSSAAAEYDSIRGKIVSAWKLDGRRLRLRVVIPPNVSAIVHVPTANPRSLRESGRPASEAAGVHPLASAPGEATVAIGAGQYRFEADAPAAP